MKLVMVLPILATGAIAGLDLDQPADAQTQINQTVSAQETAAFRQ